MSEVIEHKALYDYAKLAKLDVIEAHSDLNPTDHAAPQMLAWCREQGNLVVLENGDVLTSAPTSRAVQNCKVLMRNKGLTIGFIRPAVPAIISSLLENAKTQEEEERELDAGNVSAQQQRLRILVREAIRAGASDIHMEIRSNIVRIRFRKHGELYLYAEWLPKIGREVASVAFNKETDQSSTHFNPNVPQNASMPLDVDGHDVRLRLASLPAHDGFDVVMRILTTQDENVPTLKELGYTDQDIEIIEKAINMPHGAIIMSGPTGSGKTTTLASCMMGVDHDRKLYMIEDPVEKIIPGATQVPVNTEQYDRSFGSMARTALRMDPDIIVLGETRDEDTAAVMIRAAMTGHLVLTTVHANTSPEVIGRLADLGVSRNLLSGPNVIVCLICQRLVPTLCTSCSISIMDSKEHAPFIPMWRETFGDAVETLRVRHVGGCPKCNGTGIGGRTVAAEVLWVDETGREYIQRDDMIGWMRYLKLNGWHTYEDQLLSLVKEGRVDPLDAEKIMGQINPKLREKSYHYEKDQQAQQVFTLETE